MIINKTEFEILTKLVEKVIEITGSKEKEKFGFTDNVTIYDCDETGAYIECDNNEKFSVRIWRSHEFEDKSWKFDWSLLKELSYEVANLGTYFERLSSSIDIVNEPVI